MQLKGSEVFLLFSSMNMVGWGARALEARRDFSLSDDALKLLWLSFKDYRKKHVDLVEYYSSKELLCQDFDMAPNVIVHHVSIRSLPWHRCMLAADSNVYITTGGGRAIGELQCCEKNRFSDLIVSQVSIEEEDIYENSELVKKYARPITKSSSGNRFTFDYVLKLRCKKDIDFTFRYFDRIVRLALKRGVLFVIDDKLGVSPFFERFDQLRKTVGAAIDQCIFYVVSSSSFEMLSVLTEDKSLLALDLYEENIFRSYSRCNVLSFYSI